MKSPSFILVAFLILLPISHASADIIYSLVDNSGPNHTIGGSITTDGTLGLIGISNITAWSVEVTGDHIFSFDSSDVGASVLDFGIPPDVTATPTSIIISGAGSFGLSGEADLNPQYRYESGSSSLFTPSPGSILEAQFIGSTGEYLFAGVATVPEPSSIALMALSAIGLCVYRTRRKRKQTAA